MAIGSLHPTYFMIDDIDADTGKKEDKSEFFSREPGYDLAFSAAFELLGVQKRYKTPDDLFELFAKIHDLACLHIRDSASKISDEVKKRETDQVSFSMNGFGFSNNGIIADEGGLADIIRAIWIEKQPFILLAKESERTRFYVFREFLYESQGASSDNEGVNEMIGNVMNPNAEGIILRNGQNTLPFIQQKIMSIFQKGLFSASSKHRVYLFCYADYKTRKNMALDALKNYLDRIKKASASNEKIRLIAKTATTLLHLHMWNDGNGRSAYLFANFLMKQNDLGYFYPLNMCLFDANSEDNMVKQIIQGQARYQEKFGTPERLHTGLKMYSSALSTLSSLILNANIDMKKAFAERKFNLLFRQAAQKAEYFDLLKLMGDNRNHLDIDITSKGEKSGNAADVAQKFKNIPAQNYLGEIGLKTSAISTQS